jgi:hypothetical protein
LYGTFRPQLFTLVGMSKKTKLPTASEQALLDEVHVQLLEPSQQRRFQGLLGKHHYLGGIHPVGERLYYVATDAQGRWVALMVFSAAAKHLKHRDRWIGWSPRQRDRRLSLVVNQSRFLLLPDRTVPNLGSRVLRLTLDRLSADWQGRYGHPVLVVETFVDPEQFDGTVYAAQGWLELGPTDGWGRCRRDYYVKHDKPKRLFVRELCRNACRSLQAEHLRAELAGVEQKVIPACQQKVKEIRSIAKHFKAVPEFRARVESYPLWSLLTLMLLAMLSGAPRGQKDLSKFAKRLTQPQRRALGIRRNRQGRYPAPSQATFCRLLQRVDGAKVNAAVLAIQEQLRGPLPSGGLIVLDGKEPRHGGGDSILTAIHAPSQYYLGSALVDQKTNEIPVARQLMEPLDLQGRLVSLDALHTQSQTARMVVMDKGADYLLTVKDNQLGVRQNIEKLIPAPPAGFSPSGAHPPAGAHGRVE